MEYPLCIKPSKNVNFFVNAIIHVFILLTIISAFFFVYVSSLARDKFHNELSDSVNDNLGPALEKADTNKYIKTLLQNLGPNLEQAKQSFHGENESTRIENKWLMQVTIGMIAGLIILMIVVIFIIKLFCRKVPFVAILKENIILFSLVGIVEVVFFLFIAKNFIPTKPSLVMETVINSLKDNFNQSNISNLDSSS